MPPIPIHKNAPINAPPTTSTSDTPTTAAKPDGVTPRTANPPPTRTTPASVPATTTQPAYNNDNPPLPQPGARPLPPTAAARPTGTTNDPPPPQPGAHPSTITATHTTTTTHSPFPPPQLSIPPPSDSQLATRSTTITTEPSHPGPTTLKLGPATSAYQPEHTGGAVPSEEPRSSFEHPPGYVQSPDNTPYSAGGVGQSGGGETGAGDGGAGGAAWNMLSKAGEALKKGEEAVWRNVRSKG